VAVLPPKGSECKGLISDLTCCTSQPMFHNPLQLVSDCRTCLSPCAGGELGSLTWVLALVSPSTSPVCLVGQAGRHVPVFCWVGFQLVCCSVLVEASSQGCETGQDPCVSSTLQRWWWELSPREQLGVTAQPVLPLAPAEGVGPRSGCFPYMSISPPETFWQKAIRLSGICFLLV